MSKIKKGGLDQYGKV